MDLRQLEYLMAHRQRELAREVKQERLAQKLKREQQSQPRQAPFLLLMKQLVQVRGWIQVGINWWLKGRVHKVSKTLPNHYR